MKMNICTKKSPIDATRVLYKSGALCNWMNRTVASNGCKWLIEGLKSLITLNCKFDILSPSANTAEYEYETYLALKQEGYTCNFYVGDLIGKSLYQNRIDRDGFIYIRKNQEAKDIKLSNKVDIICDFKGATWYALRSFKSNKNLNLIQNLEAFSSYLKNDDSKFVIDIYKYRRIRSISNIWNYAIMNGKTTKKHTKQEEVSTGCRLAKYLKKRQIENRFKLADNCTLSYNTISLCYISKKDLNRLIEDLKRKYEL